MIFVNMRFSQAKMKLLMKKQLCDLKYTLFLKAILFFGPGSNSNFPKTGLTLPDKKVFEILFGKRAIIWQRFQSSVRNNFRDCLALLIKVLLIKKACTGCVGGLRSCLWKNNCATLSAGCVWGLVKWERCTPKVLTISHIKCSSKRFRPPE